MLVSLVVALGHDFVIGDGLRMPWHLRADLRRFRQLTLGKPLIMGRKTYDSLGRPLPGRDSIVLTRQSLVIPGCHVASTTDDALAVAHRLAGERGVGEVAVIGGGEVYRLFLTSVRRVYLTVVDGAFGPGVTFPFDDLRTFPWRSSESETVGADEHNSHAHRYFVLDRCDGSPELACDLGPLIASPFNLESHTRA